MIRRLVPRKAMAMLVADVVATTSFSVQIRTTTFQLAVPLSIGHATWRASKLRDISLTGTQNAVGKTDPQPRGMGCRHRVLQSSGIFDVRIIGVGLRNTVAAPKGRRAGFQRIANSRTRDYMSPSSGIMQDTTAQMIVAENLRCQLSNAIKGSRQTTKFLQPQCTSGASRRGTTTFSYVRRYPES